MSVSDQTLPPGAMNRSAPPNVSRPRWNPLAKGRLAIVLQLLLLAIVVMALYGRTLDVPFYLDDIASILENRAVTTPASIAALWHFAGMRFIGYLSLAVNYYVHQDAVAGYHLVNMIIHFLAGCAVLLLARGLRRTPVTINHDARYHQPGLDRFAALPLLAALLFLVHPLQTQAVTYIVQRLASMAGMFYIGALACYVHARLARSTRRQWLLGGGAALLGLLALFTKQNTVTLPLAILLVEIIFFQPPVKRLVIAIAITLTLLALMYSGLALLLHKNPFSMTAIQTLSRETTTINRSQYLATQTTVLWLYLKLFFRPVNLLLDYDVPLATGFMQGSVLLATGGHLLLLCLAVVWVRRRPWLAFGILFYYTAHLVESSLIPIRDLAFEHRTYLPNLGLCLATAWGILRLAAPALDRRFGKPAVLIAIAMVILLLGIRTVQRNNDWRQPLEFWQHNVQQAPNKARPHLGLGLAYDNRGNPRAAIHEYEKALAIRPDYARALSNLGNALLKVKRTDEAVARLTMAVRMMPRKAQAHYNLGNALEEQGNFAGAAKAYTRALALQPEYARAHYNLAFSLAADHKTDAAIIHYKEALRLTPNDVQTMNNLAVLYAGQNRMDEAIGQLQQAVRRRPGNVASQMNLGQMLSRLGRFNEAIPHFEAVIQVDPSHGEAHFMLGTLLAETGDLDRATAQFRLTLQIDPSHAGAQRNLELIRTIRQSHLPVTTTPSPP